MTRRGQSDVEFYGESFVGKHVTGKKFKYRKMPMGTKSANQAYHSIARQLLFRDIPSDNFAHNIDDATIFRKGFLIL